jgi:hypothetical protein
LMASKSWEKHAVTYHTGVSYMDANLLWSYCFYQAGSAPSNLKCTKI